MKSMIFVSLIYFYVKSICNPNLTFQFIFSEDFLNDTNSTPRRETIVNQSSNQEKSDIEIPNDDAGAQDQTEQVPNSDSSPNLGPDVGSGSLCPYTCKECNLNFNDVEEFTDHMEDGTCFRCKCGAPHKTFFDRIEHFNSNRDCANTNY